MFNGKKNRLHNRRPKRNSIFCEACTDDGSPCYNLSKPTEPITDTSTYYCNADTRFVKDLDYYIPNVDKKPVSLFNAEDYCSNSSNSKEMCKKTCEAAGILLDRNKMLQRR